KSNGIELVYFESGEVLFHENEESYHFFVIQEGSVEVFKDGDDGVRLPLTVVSEGSALGEFAMINRAPRSATARAITPVRAAKISEAAYQELLNELPDWAMSVIKSLIDRLHKTNEIIRKGRIVSPDLRREIEATEFDPDSGTITDSTPFLTSSGLEED
ncbi:MAG: cyclic nucleotide-binding domain-containing protein, partial [Proteobacteria bacterium]